MELTVVEVGQLMQLPEDGAWVAVTNPICVPLFRHLAERQAVALRDTDAEGAVFEAALTKEGGAALAAAKDQPWRKPYDGE